MHPPRVGSRATAERAPVHRPGPPRTHAAPTPPPVPQQRRMVMALAARPESVPLARGTLRRLLTAWRIDPDEDTAAGAVLVLSELVTNAITHGTAEELIASSVTLSVSLLPPPAPGAPRVLRLSVHDPGRTRPRLRRADAEEEHGRGLLLVSATTDRWGCESLPGDGKRVWAELDLLP
ncbi:ATP-binding protein [Peterkaempfera bronchialis]|uniref:ATP-binding protein n=1 Tax=Peterkaempfera bronchialis TaxID=2126346 RepID=UPI0013B46756|nr:ATP-binding protein [Peterkaempfera bronchialis]